MNPRLLAALVTLSVAMSTMTAPVTFAACEDGTTPAWFRLDSSGTGFTWCHLPFNPGLVTVTVQVVAVPFQKAHLVLPDPPLGTVVGETWGVSYTGDRFNGLEVDLGGCSEYGLVTIGALFVFVRPDEAAECQFWRVADGCQIQDCSGKWLPATPVEFEVGTSGNCEICCFQCCESLPPYDLYPPDGATDVPFDVVLSWVSPNGYDPPPPFVGCHVRISTEPTCGTGQTFTVPCETDAFAPDFLEPGTTYYWQPGWVEEPSGCSNGWSGEASIHSFTTEGPVPAKQSTWGRVKALYGE
jgi:hypothetical protein